MQLVLSLFPGIDLLGLAFKREGFCVVQGGDVIFGGDIRAEHYPAGRFDGIIGGPPCQCFSRLAAIVRANGHSPKFGNLISEFERVVREAQPTWFVMENVPDAPLPSIINYATWSTVLNNRQCFDEGGKPAKQNRVRRWTFGDRRTGRRTVLMIDTAALEAIEFRYAATGAGDPQIPVKLGGSGKPKRNKVGRLVTRDVLSNGTQRTQRGFTCVKELQGLPEDFDPIAFTVAAKVQAVANGVPLPMGRAIAKAVREATEKSEADC